MKILFVANHGNHDNCDESAISYALRMLGHEVLEVQQRQSTTAAAVAKSHNVDFCLFLKWDNPSSLRETAAVAPCVFWYFDLVANQDDPTLALRMESRRRWFYDVMRYCVGGFCTDGDWVDQWNATQKAYGNKLYWLMQGMDERVAGPGDASQCNLEVPEILFTGMINHGSRRREHVHRLQTRYGRRFGVFGDGGPRFRLHGRALADLFAKAKIVVAPDGPCTDRYWSNRVYLTLGLGGFLMHPQCAGLRGHYAVDELVTYKDRETLELLIDDYLDDPSTRENLRVRGYEATMARHLYRHRCEELVRTVGRLL